MQDKTKEIYMYFLGALVVIAAFLFGLALIFYPIPEGNKEGVMLVAGILVGLAVVVVNYFFGTSKSSSDKTAIIAQQKQVQ